MIIEFAFNHKILFLFIFPIVFQFEPFITKLYIKEDKDYLLFRMFRIFFSQLLFIVFILIIKCRSKKSPGKINLEKKLEADDKNVEKIKSQIETELQKNDAKKFRRNILILFGLSALDLAAFFINYYYYGESGIKIYLNTIGIIFEIITFGLLSYFILKQRFYKHHYVSFGIIFILLMTLFIIYVIETEFYWYIIIYYFFYTLFYSLYCVFGKKYLVEYFKTPYYMLFMIGLINSFGLLIYDIIAYFINDEYSGIIKGFRDNIVNVQSFFCLLLELIVKFIYTAGIWISIYDLTPCHFIISDFTAEMISFYVKIINKTNIDNYFFTTTNIIMFSIIFVINLICSLIFNEVLIVKFFGLHYYTDKYIKKREHIELTTLKATDTFDTLLTLD